MFSRSLLQSNQAAQSVPSPEAGRAAVPASNRLASIAEAAQSSQSPMLRRFYQSLDALAAQLQAPDCTLDELPLLALDLETTGLNPEVDDIVSIGLIPMTLQRIGFGQRRHWILKPDAEMQDDTIQIHQITHSEVAKAPDLSDILEDFLTCLHGRIAVVHCAAVEETFLDTAIRNRLGEGLTFLALDTMGLSSFVRRQQPERYNLKQWIKRLSRPSDASKPKLSQSLRLADVRNAYGLPFYPQHNALHDALATGELLQAMSQHHSFNAIPPMELLDYR